MCVQNLKSVALPVSEIIGVPKNLGKSLVRRTLPIPPNPLVLPRRLFFYVHSFPRIFDWSFSSWLRTSNLEESGWAYGVEDGTVRKSVGEFL